MGDDAHISSLQINDEQLAGRLHALEERFDTLDTPWPKRVVFRLDGWGPWYRVRERPRPRPWRRWWTS